MKFLSGLKSDEVSYNLEHLKKVTARTPQLYQRLDGGRLTPRQVYFATTLYRIFMALTYTNHPILLYESTNCIYSAPTGRTCLKGGMANLPTVKPWNTPP